MNFEKIAPVESSKTLLDVAFKKARERSKEKKLSGEWEDIIRKKESLKLDIIKDTLVSKLEDTLSQFPQTEVLPEFYIKLMRLTLDYAAMKKSLGAVNWCSQRVKIFHREYVRKIVKMRSKEMIHKISLEFYGRISSTIKQIDENLKYLEECRRIMRTYPDIKDLFTVCIYGFPNVGKTTFLNKLADTKAKTAAYAFTTKSINVGYLRIDGMEVQVLDLPGTLARPEKMNNIELQAELALQELAKMIIFVFDLSESSGYSLEMQTKLFKKIQPLKPLIYISKTDLPGGMPGEDFPYKYYSFESIKEELMKAAQKEAAKKAAIAAETVKED
ncbi:MAG: GTPase [Nanoarchaeota archaeon]